MPTTGKTSAALTHLSLRNFQCHSKLSLDFSDTVTTIVGRTDVGKSAIVRALSWILFNRPAGTSLIRHGSKGARATVHLGSGDRITRQRTTTKNTYSLNGAPLKAFGRGVPDTVTKLLRTDSTSLQGQLDPPLWFTESGPEIGRRLNEIVSLDLIDHTLSKCNSLTNTGKERVNLCKERLAEARTVRKRCAFAKEMDAELCKIESLVKQLHRNEDKRLELGDLVHRAEAMHNRLETHKQQRGDLQELQELAEECIGVTTSADELAQTIEEADRLSKQIDSLKDDANKAHKELEKQMKGKPCPLCGKSV